MTLSITIKVAVIAFIFSILPYCACAQNEESAFKEEWFKKEWIIWNKVRDWRMPSFEIFKWNKEKVKEDTHKNQYSVGTNLLNWAYFGTANFEMNASISNHFSVFAGGKYNSLNFETKAYKEIFANQITGYAGIKWWPWFVNTGWWIGLKGQYSDFSNAGIFTTYLREGKAAGAGLSGGYSFMLGTHFNLDLGLGVWGGAYLDYTDYEHPTENKKMFINIDNIQVSFTYLF